MRASPIASRGSPTREALIPLVASRLLVWVVGAAAYATLSLGPDGRAPAAARTITLGDLGNPLAAPAVRWDANFYIDIASRGYEQSYEAAFFPLYPLLVRGLDLLTGAILASGVLISMVAFGAALVLLQRLTALELGEEPARRSVWLLAFFPFSLFFSAFYTEGLFLALAIGTFYSARTERWALAGLLGGLAALTRNAGVLLVVPVLLMALYGPRSGEPARAGAWWRPRYAPSASLAWAVLIPGGFLAFAIYAGLRFDEPFAVLEAHDHFGRSFEGPLSSVVLGAGDAAGSAADLLRGGGDEGFGAALREIGLFGLAAATLVATAGVLRTLPPAYGAYTVVAVLSALSTPQVNGPLAHSPRFIAAIFPVFMWLGLRLERRRDYVAVLTVFAAGLVYCVAAFATWRFVA